MYTIDMEHVRMSFLQLKLERQYLCVYIIRTKYIYLK